MQVLAAARFESQPQVFLQRQIMYLHFQLQGYRKLAVSPAKRVSTSHKQLCNSSLQNWALGVSLRIRDDKDSLQGANSEISCSLSYV